MRRSLADLSGLLGLATLVLGVLYVLHTLGRDLALHLYLLVLCGILLLATLRATRAALPERDRSRFEQALRREPPGDERPPQLERVERGVTLGVSLAQDFHVRLRPLLREAARARLAVSRGVDLDSPAGRAALGEEAWELLRPDREPPTDRFGPGLDPARLARLVDEIESL
ncbi:MAG TPA: hypothetical protein VFI37_12030 [Gaiellaceae bacterium]|jgi:hypothetical protein|nr:hypothetical protein [Gaiellaceae bacterium]